MVDALLLYLTAGIGWGGTDFRFEAGGIGSLQTTAGQAYLMEATGRGRLGRASAGTDWRKVSTPDSRSMARAGRGISPNQGR